MNAIKAISKNDEELRVGNYIVLFGGRDLQWVIDQKPNPDGSRGEYFTEETEFKSAYTDTGRLLVDWEHGLGKQVDGTVEAPGRDDVLGYVDWTTAKKDEKGLWVERVLNRRNMYVKFLEQLIDAGLVGSSSEPVQGKTKRGSNGEIKRWPLRRDTLTVNPMEPRMLTENVVHALKGLNLITDLEAVALEDAESIDGAATEGDDKAASRIHYMTMGAYELRTKGTDNV